ncbi:MAG: ADP-ribosylglycohydrolase family protein [Phycisphaerae bacterium]|nr:ADP-ribosylglycohydrolase family protein [Phycisphaerae bacterium]
METDVLNRRRFLRRAGASAVGALALAGPASLTEAGRGKKAKPSKASLYDKMFGCLAGSRIASAMGAAVEGWSMDRITEKYGVFDKLVAYHHYNVDWDHPAGSTEDGIERQKLMCTAIIEKQDGITARDLVKTWIKVLDPNKMKYMTEGFDRELLAHAKSGSLRPWQLGSLSKHAHLNTTARSFHALAVINACDIDGVIRDVYEIGRVYQPPNSDSFEWGAAYNAGVVHAMTPDATVDSVIGTVLKHSTDEMRKEIQNGLDIAAKHSDPLNIRAELNEVYAGKDGPYAAAKRMKSYHASSIYETVTKALAVFVATRGNVKDATITAINFGRDTDCLGATAAALAGAFSGTATIPPEWIEAVEQGTRNNPYTNSRLTIKETADGMYSALKAKVSKMKDYAVLVESQY